MQYKGRCQRRICFPTLCLFLCRKVSCFSFFLLLLCITVIVFGQQFHVGQNLTAKYHIFFSEQLILAESGNSGNLRTIRIASRSKLVNGLGFLILVSLVESSKRAFKTKETGTQPFPIIRCV